MSPTRAAHVCNYPSCPTLVRNGPRCPAHTVTREERYPHDPAQAQFYGSTQWKKLRAIVKARDPICKICNRSPTTEADHIDDNWENNDLGTNLQGVCTDCHATKSGRQHYWRRADVPVNSPFLVLCGMAGVGKTTIRNHLAKLLDCVSMGPDDYDGKWPVVYEILDRSHLAIVECVIPPGALVRRAEDRGVFVVQVTIPDQLRRQRLKDRGESRLTVEQRMRELPRLGYERLLTPNLTVDATNEPLTNARLVAQQFRLARPSGGQEQMYR